MLSLVVAIHTLPGSHPWFPCSYLLLPAHASGPQPCAQSDPFSSHPLSFPTSNLFHLFLCLSPGPNPVLSESCPHHRGIHQHGCLPIPYCVPGTSRGDAKFLPCECLKKITNNLIFYYFFYLKTIIKVLGFDQCEFCVTGFTVLGVIVFFPLAGVGAPFLPALSKGSLRKKHLSG